MLAAARAPALSRAAQSERLPRYPHGSRDALVSHATGLIERYAWPTGAASVFANQSAASPDYRGLFATADGSVLVHSDGGSYKPLNWMSPPCTVREGSAEDGRVEWTVTAKAAKGAEPDTLRILIEEVLHDSEHDLGIDPGLNGADLDPAMRMVFWPAVAGWILLGVWICTLFIRYHSITEKRNAHVS